MSFELPNQHRRSQPRVHWLAASFLVEAMLLLLFIMASLAILTSMFAESAERSVQSRSLTEAVALATSAAERFSADPSSVAANEVEGGYIVTCDVAKEPRPGGTMYRATVRVYEAEGESAGEGKTTSEEPASTVAQKAIYELSTCKYESGV